MVNVLVLLIQRPRENYSITSHVHQSDEVMRLYQSSVIQDDRRKIVAVDSGQTLGQIRHTTEIQSRSSITNFPITRRINLALQLFGETKDSTQKLDVSDILRRHRWCCLRCNIARVNHPEMNRIIIVSTGDCMMKKAAKYASMAKISKKSAF